MASEQSSKSGIGLPQPIANVLSRTAPAKMYATPSKTSSRSINEQLRKKARDAAGEKRRKRPRPLAAGG